MVFVCWAVAWDTSGGGGFGYTLVRLLIIETCQVLAAGLVLALVVNQVSPRGLRLGRDYFQESARVTGDPTAGAAAPVLPSPQVESLKRLPEITADTALALFRDPRRVQGQVIFVDARKQTVFQEGHIPEAYPLDRFYPDQDLPSVLLAGVAAEQVVVYCAGGACEDSHYAALQLIEAGLEASRIRVFAGGFTEWTAHSWPVERGERGSGLVSNPLP